MAMHNEQFFVKWNDFQSNVAKAFPLLQHESDFYGVTLVSDDNRKISAHKVVLATCSQYFKRILKGSQHPNPMLCLDGIKFTDVNNILDYIYNGEVKIEEEGLNRFLEIAQRFQLDGIGIGDETVANNYSVDELTPKSQFSPVIEKFENEIMDDTKSFNPWFRGQRRNKVIDLNPTGSNRLEETIDELYTKVRSEQYNGVWYTCNVCEKGFKKKCHIREHVVSHIKGLSFTCNECNKKFTTSHLLRDHRTKTCPSFKLLNYSL